MGNTHVAGSVSTETVLRGPCHFNTDPEALVLLLAQLRRLDRRIEAQVTVARRETGDHFHGLCISEADLDALLAVDTGSPHAAPLPGWSSAALPNTQPGEYPPRLAALPRIFGLTDFEIECLLVAFAP